MVVANLAKQIALTAPDAFILIITNPVNSLVPVVAEIMKSENAFNPRKLFGVTTIDVIRAFTFAAEATSTVPSEEFVIPVVGGHSSKTIVPLFSLSNPPLNIDEEKLAALTMRVQLGGDEIMKAKKDNGSATLSMAYAAYK